MRSLLLRGSVARLPVRCTRERERKDRSFPRDLPTTTTAVAAHFFVRQCRAVDEMKGTMCVVLLY